MVAGKGALEAGQRPEKHVEDPEGEGDETSALFTWEMVAGRGHWKQVRPEDEVEVPEGEGDETSALCTWEMVAWKGALEAGQRPENQVEDPEGEGYETSAGDQANHDAGHAHTCSTVRML